MVFDLLPKLADVDAQILGVLSVRRSPDRREDLFVCDDTPGMLSEEGEQFEFLRREFKLRAGTRCAMPHRINLEIADMQNGDFRLALHAMPQCRAHAREKLTDIERLVDIIVSAEIERFNLFGFALARRQYDNRYIRPFTSAFDDFFAVSIRKTEVE